MMIGTKTPDEVKTWTFDWTQDLGTDSINTSSWTITPEGCSVTGSIVTGNLMTNALISGGLVGQVYYVSNAVVTAMGNTLTKVFRLYVEVANIV